MQRKGCFITLTTDKYVYSCYETDIKDAMYSMSCIAYIDIVAHSLIILKHDICNLVYKGKLLYFCFIQRNVIVARLKLYSSHHCN